MSNVSNNMTTKLNGTNEIEEALTTKLGNNDVFNRNRIVNTIGAAVGGAVGVGITALSPESNIRTLGISAGWAVGTVLGVYVNKESHGKEEVSIVDGVIAAGASAISTSIVGSVFNYLLGNAESEEVKNAEEVTEVVA